MRRGRATQCGDRNEHEGGSGKMEAEVGEMLPKSKNARTSGDGRARRCFPGSSVGSMALTVESEHSGPITPWNLND